MSRFVDLTVEQRTLLVCFVCHANADLDAWPGLDLIERETGLKKDRYSRVAAELIAQGWVKRRRRKNQSSVYSLNPLVTRLATDDSIPAGERDVIEMILEHAAESEKSGNRELSPVDNGREFSNPDVRNSQIAETEGQKTSKKKSSLPVEGSSQIATRSSSNVVELPVATEMTDAEIAEQIFGYFRSTMSKPRAKFTKARCQLITRRLRDGWTIEELHTAIAGCAGSAWHQGENDRGIAYNSIELIFRGAEKIEQFIDLAGKPARPRSMAEARSQRTADNIQRAVDNIRAREEADDDAG